MKNEVSFPCMEPTRCFFAFDSPDRRLSAARSGEVSLSENRKEFEKWHLVPNDDGTTGIRSVAHGTALAASSDGKIGAGRGSGDDRKWCVEREGVKCRLIHFLSNKSMVVAEGGVFLCEDRQATPWTMELLSGEICVLRNAEFDKHVSCGPFGHLKMVQDRGGWEA